MWISEREDLGSLWAQGLGSAEGVGRASSPDPKTGHQTELGAEKGADAGFSVWAGALGHRLARGRNIGACSLRKH